MSRESQSEWAKRVERWRDSGLTAKEFAAETGLNASTLSYWKWRLSAGRDRNQASADTGGSVRGASGRRRKASTPAAQFVEVSPIAGTPSSAAMLEVVLRDGTVVRVPADFDETTLGRVVRTLEAAR
jgi:hypothetical protein